MAKTRRVYIDSCCFIDAVKVSVGQTLANDKERDVWYLKRLLEANRDSEVRLFTSVMTIAECSHVGRDKPLTDKVKSEFSRLLMSGQYVQLVQATPFIAQDARDLVWNNGILIKGMDSIHVASAIAMKCEEFLSVNGKLIRLEAQGSKLGNLGLSAKRPQNTGCLPSKYLQLKFDNGKPIDDER